MDVEEALLILWLRCAIEEDCTPIPRLVGLVLRLSGVAVLQMDDGDVVTRGGFQKGEVSRVGIEGEFVEDLVAGVHWLAGDGEDVGWDCVGEGRVG